MARRGLYANINARKKAGTSRPKSKSIVYFNNNKKLKYAINDCLIICSKFINEK